MEAARQKISKFTWQSRRLLAAVFGVIIIVGAPITDAVSTRGEIYPGVSAGTVKIGGMSAGKASEALKQQVDAFLNQYTIFTLGQGQASISLRKIISFDIGATIENALEIGHQEDISQTVKQRLRARASGIIIDPVFTIDQNNLETLFRKTFQEYKNAPQDAKFAFTFEKNTRPLVSIIVERPGEDIDLTAAARALEEQARIFLNQSVELKPRQVSALLTSADLEKLLPAVQALFSSAPPEIKSKDKKWTITYPTLAEWVMAEKQDDGVKLLLNGYKIKHWLDEAAKEVAKKPVDAVFELSEDQQKVVKFALAENGVALPRDENAAHIAESILSGKTAELILYTIEPGIHSAPGAETYGIEELVGQGSTNFAGSPPNRIKNINRGAEILYGNLIAAGEEFSLLEQLRPFTSENGYLAELVIKPAEGRTVPEIGGGLCQIGTTAFRTVLNSGLPITARRNHSYRVSYYEPPVGMDATIYDPWPDFRFINDTGGWLLLTTSVEGTKITFYLWGAKDGREIEITEPEVFNFVKPPEKKIIETPDLPVGQTRCTERAHIGSDAKFTYTVTYSNGEIKQEEFSSHYRPWQEVCLLGVESLPEPEEAKGGSGTTAPETAGAAAKTLPSADVIGATGSAGN